jgi:hypothetical protein
LTLLQVALEVLDRADAARDVISEQGLTIKTLATGTTHANPILRVEADARRQFAKLWQSMGLEMADVDRFRDGCWEGKPGLGLPK